MIKSIEEFVKRRNEALFSLDRDKIIKFYELAYSKSEAKKFAKVDEKVFSCPSSGSDWRGGLNLAHEIMHSL